MSEISTEIALRRTFAIISHPDAGKTTLTEKLLLYAGMIQTAGMVRGRKSAKHASSDWMSMERERGISITASAMQFRYKGTVINVLDTPGHQDFSEDTYRTLTAADSAVMVIDAAKGVETQTRKLFTVCRMRNTPILTFINKMDLPGRDPLDLLAEVEGVLNISAAPLNWPIGSGKEFRGIYDLRTERVLLFERSEAGGSQRAAVKDLTVAEAVANGEITKEQADELESACELLREAGNPYTREAFLAGTITPVFFGSALTNFGVEPFFDSFVEVAPPPSARVATDDSGETITVDPASPEFSGYVFKIQANMDPKHRDSMAFIRICSGRFERDLVVHHERLEKEIRLSRSHSMFGGDRVTLDAAFPGDIVGVVNPHVFAIGDTVSVNGGFRFLPMPKFPPEVVARIRPKDVLRKKSFDKGMQQLSNEGAVLVLEISGNRGGDLLVAAVGQLQFDVLQYRLRDEYQVETILDGLPYRYGAWIRNEPGSLQLTSNSVMASDLEGRKILLYSQEWEKNYIIEKNKGLELADFV